MKKQRLLLGATVCFTIAAMGVAWILGGCAAKNLTGIAKTNQQTAIVLADECTAAAHAKAAYDAGTIPQTAGTRAAINGAITACEDAKKAVNVALEAEIAYKNAVQSQVVSCTPQPGAITPPENPQCQAASQNTQAKKAASDNAIAAADSSLATLASKTAAVKSLK